jgi:hypothetical protein
MPKTDSRYPNGSRMTGKCRMHSRCANAVLSRILIPSEPGTWTASRPGSGRSSRIRRWQGLFACSRPRAATGSTPAKLRRPSSPSRRHSAGR